jgi:inhibitor of cysteine peptidase
VKNGRRELAVSASVLAAVLAGIVVAAISGCSARPALVLGAKDEGRQIELQTGETLTINLEGNPTTGYTWELVESKGAIMRQIGEAEFKADSDLVGAGGMQTLRFEAVTEGQMELTLVYHRPWETGVEPLETFTVQVTVK